MPKLRKADIERLSKIIDFLEIELGDVEKYKDLDFPTYRADREKMRSVERWIENITNSSLDIAKIVLISKDAEIPDTYKQYFLDVFAIGLITSEVAEKLAEGTKLRNVLAHRYLDIKWSSIREFLSRGWLVYKEWLDKSKDFLKKESDSL